MTAPRLAVAFSGGRDSTALLHATARAAGGQGLEVVALHVHHGLSLHADAWLAHAASTCRRWAGRGLPLRFVAERLQGQPGPADSIEAWARRERYRALARMARATECRLVLLAHHRQDQAETFLLQALRGAGPAGLAAMPAAAERDGIVWCRPWLSRPRSEIEAYVRRHRLAFIDDDSNADARFARNRLRLQVWPALAAAFPEAEAALANAATRAAHADAALDELAAIDLHGAPPDAALDVAAWLALSPARRANSLRAWLRGAMAHVPGSLIDRLMAELGRAAPARWPAAGGELRYHGGRLRFHAPPLEQDRGIDGWAGRLRVQPVGAQGLAVAMLEGLRAAPREGGEQFQAGPGRPPRSLKKQYQALRIAPWDRDGPLLWHGEQLVFVPGLGIDARAWAAEGEPQVQLHWEPG